MLPCIQMALASTNSSTEADIRLQTTKFSDKKIGKQGLLKKILKKGISWKTPFPGDEVEVHFSGHVEGGECLDSTRNKGVPFVFKLGQGEVIKGLDDGVATMKKGERAIFKVPPNLAYGEAGSPPLIPSNATLVFDVEMLSWSSVRDLTGDGGILKKITKEGDGWATPRDGDQVLVKYEARLENGLLASKSEEGAEFHIGDGYLCPALGLAVKTMRRGEKADLSVKCSYGFSQNGNIPGEIGRSIHLNSNLTVQLELVSWRSVIDITGNKQVLKTIIKAGEGFERPNEGSQVKVAYTGKMEDGTVFEKKGTAEEPFEYITLEDQINNGLDRAIMTMKKGEHALITISADCFSGHEILRKFQANSVLRYEVELIDFIKEKPFWKMDALEKLEACEKKKLEGNVFFKAQKFWLASKKYEKVLSIKLYRVFPLFHKCLAKELRLSCLLNNAACKLKLEEYLEASRLCTKVLEQEPLNVKALFRRSQAYLNTSELEKAEDDIKKALIVDPNNRDLKLIYKELKDKQREYTKYQAEIFGTMISRMS